MQISEVSIGKIKADPANPRIHDPLIPKLVDAIKQFGFRVPILVRKDMTIVDGEGRFKAARELGMERIPVIFIDDMSPEQIRAFRISVNQMATLADWDEFRLQDELTKLSTSFDTDQISKLTAFDKNLVETLVQFTANKNGDAATSADPDITEYKNDVLFPVGEWGLPLLRDDVLYDGPPPHVWIGPESPKSDLYLYVYSTDSPNDLDWKKAIVGFWTADHKQDKVWVDTGGVVKRFKEMGIVAAVSPDFSVFHNWPLPLTLYNMYRNLFIGRFFQEAGIPIVVNLCYPGDPAIGLSLLSMVPKNAIWARQLQSKYTKEERRTEAFYLEEIVKRRPKALWLYAADKTISLFSGILNEAKMPVYGITPRIFVRRQVKGF